MAHPNSSFNEIATLHIKLCGTDLLIWREVVVPTSLTLKSVHEVIQAAMGWFDLHPWEFRIGDRLYGPAAEKSGSKPLRKDASKTRLRQVLKPGLTRMNYLYDFQDRWEHLLTISDPRPGDPQASYPCYVGGERNAPPEGCGGIIGYNELRAALIDPGNPDHQDARFWAGDYDPDRVDELPIEYALSRIARSRNGARARIRGRD